MLRGYGEESKAKSLAVEESFVFDTRNGSLFSQDLGTIQNAGWTLILQ